MSIRMDLQETSISEEENCSKPIYFPLENSLLALSQNTAFENSIACSESIAVLPILLSKMEEENNGSKEESKKTDDIQENQEINLLKRTIQIQNENIILLKKEIEEYAKELTKLKNEFDKLQNNKKTIKINSKQSQKQRQADQQQLEQFKPEQIGISQTKIDQVDNNNESEIIEVKKGRKKQKNNDLTNSPPKKPAKEPIKKKEFPERVVINGSLGEGVFHKTLVQIACWNINGIRAAIKKEAIHSFLSGYDVICLNETKIDEESLQKEGLYHQLKSINSSYEQYYFCSVKKGYSGVAIFSKEKAISVKQGIDATEFDVEGRVLTAEFDQFIVMTVYVPYNNQNNKIIDREQYRNNFDRTFKEYVTKLQNSYPDKPVIICGDFNVAHEDIDIKYLRESYGQPGITQMERNNFDSLLMSGWVDSFRQKNPTAKKYTSGMQIYDPYCFLEWRFDYFLINEKFIKQCKFSDIDSNTRGSDHQPILFFLEILNTKNCESLTIENEIQQNQTMIGENKQKTNMVLFENKEEQ